MLSHLCQSCLCELAPSASPIPLCQSCLDGLLALPADKRMERIADLRRNEMLTELVNHLIDLVEASRESTQYRRN